MPQSSPGQAGSPPPSGFASTEWSLVLAASSDGGPALDRLCRTYWRPAYVYARATGLDPADAEDATQEFFADMLRRDWLKLADRDRGSFRGFLRTSVQMFLQNRRRRARAEKRGGGEEHVPFDTEAVEQELARKTVDTTDPAVLYDESWADCVLNAAVERLQGEQDANGRTAVFAELKPYLTTSPGPGDYERIGEKLNLPKAQISLRVHRLSQRFAEVIRLEVAATLARRDEVETELRYLLRLVSGKS